MFIEQFKEIIKQEGVGITALAKASGIQRQYIYTILNRGNDPNPATMDALTLGLSHLTGKQYEVEITILEK